MISSHSIDDLFKPSAAADGPAARAIWAAANSYARCITDLAPQSPAVDTALRYVQLSALLAVHSIEVSV